jgi:hypothetical protein
MYLILVKYFYYFYFLKKNKKFKFFILLDLIFFLMKKYFKLLLLKKKLNKYKNMLKRINIKNLNSTMIKKINKNIYFLLKLDLFIKHKMDEFNNFIINFLPTQLLPLGNRKKFYNLFNRKFKRFFILIKKKLNKKFFFYFLVLLFRKIKFLFLKSDAFLNKDTFLFDFFSSISLESKYSSLLQLYRQVQKKDNLLKNKFLSFFNMISFFLYRIDFFLYKYLSFFSLDRIRRFIFSSGVVVNNKLVNTINYFLSKYQIIKLPSSLTSMHRKVYIFALQYYFAFINNYIYKKNNNVKFHYYLELYKKIKNKNSLFLYIKQKKQKHVVSHRYCYMDLVEDIFNYFFALRNRIYNFDLLNTYKNNYKIEYLFPFFLKEKKKNLFFNTNPKYLDNITINITPSNIKNKLFHFSFLTNFINLFFFLYKYKSLYFYTHKNKCIVSPIHIQNILNEQKKLFYYFSIVFHINVVKIL